MRIVEIFFAKAERGHPLKLLLTYTAPLSWSKFSQRTFYNCWLVRPQVVERIFGLNYGLRGCCFEDESFLGVRLTTSSSKWGNMHKNRVKNEENFFLKFLIFFSCEQGNLGVGCKIQNNLKQDKREGFPKKISRSLPYFCILFCDQQQDY